MIKNFLDSSTNQNIEWDSMWKYFFEIDHVPEKGFLQYMYFNPAPLPVLLNMQPYKEKKNTACYKSFFFHTDGL